MKVTAVWPQESSYRFLPNHAEQVKELQSISIKTGRPIKLIDALKKISIAKTCFYPLLERIKEELR